MSRATTTDKEAVALVVAALAPRFDIFWSMREIVTYRIRNTDRARESLVVVWFVIFLTVHGKVKKSTMSHHNTNNNRQSMQRSSNQHHPNNYPRHNQQSSSHNPSFQNSSSQHFSAGPSSNSHGSNEPDPFPFCRDVDDYEKITKIGQGRSCIQIRLLLLIVIFYVSFNSGTFGEVFKAKHRASKKIVALKKVLMENEKEGFPITALREIKILQLLKHENVVNLIEICATRHATATN